MTSYTINLITMKYLDLFDEIPYKDIKEFIHNDDFDDDYFVEIEHLDCERIAWCDTKITFTITINDIEKTFEKVLHYNNSSPFALAIMELEQEQDEEEDESSEESSEGEEEDESIEGEEEDESSEEEEESSEGDNILSRQQ